MKRTYLHLSQMHEFTHGFLLEPSNVIYQGKGGIMDIYV
jgi:Zn-dependent metalloprotease